MLIALMVELISPLLSYIENQPQSVRNTTSNIISDSSTILLYRSLNTVYSISANYMYNVSNIYKSESRFFIN